MNQYTRMHGFFLPNRIATMLLVIAGLAAAVLPTLANMDWTSTAGVFAGLGAVAAALVTWLNGWSKNEATNVAPFKKVNPEHAEMRERIRQLEDEIHNEVHGPAAPPPAPPPAPVGG
jgi:membrane protein implicated in regulation of membrane protease activity